MQGRIAIVTDAGRNAVDASGAFDERRLARGRRSRVVLTPRRRRQVGERNFTDDGDKKARSPGRARRKPLKPLRAGMPGDPGATVVTNARAFYTPRAAAGATGTRHSPRPIAQGAKRSRITRAYGAAGMRGVSDTSCGANGSRECAPDDRLREAIQSCFLVASWIASTRSQ